MLHFLPLLFVTSKQIGGPYTPRHLAAVTIWHFGFLSILAASTSYLLHIGDLNFLAIAVKNNLTPKF